MKRFFIIFISVLLSQAGSVQQSSAQIGIYQKMETPDEKAQRIENERLLEERRLEAREDFKDKIVGLWELAKQPNNYLLISKNTENQSVVQHCAGGPSPANPERNAIMCERGQIAEQTIRKKYLGIEIAVPNWIFKGVLMAATGTNEFLYLYSKGDGNIESVVRRNPNDFQKF